jgi:hypothetical protein
LGNLRTDNPRDDKCHIQNANGGLLKNFYCWVLDNEKLNNGRTTKAAVSSGSEVIGEKKNNAFVRCHR